MKVVKLHIEVVISEAERVECFVSNTIAKNRIIYFPKEGRLNFEVENEIVPVLNENFYQFEKVIRSAVKGKIKIGQTINCVFIEDFRFLNEDEFQQFVRVDRREGIMDVSVHCESLAHAHKLYCDGSYACDTGKAGYGGFIEAPNGNQEIFDRSFSEGSSNLMELRAVIDGLMRLKAVDPIQINTDSRYVIRGLVHWVHFWRHNNWQTAYGKPVKFVEYWKQIDELVDGKLIEFRWIKGHSNNDEQKFCHDLAKGNATS